jgi:tetratricopeptide (TPR) repeat protein
MPEPISSALGLAVMWLRNARGWTRGELARAAGLKDESLVGRYERGEKLTREMADFLAGCLGYPPEALDVLLFAHRLILHGAWEEAASPVALTLEELCKLDRAALDAGWATAESVRAELIRRKKQETADAALQEGRETWERLKAAPRQKRRPLVAALPVFRKWPVAVLACEASVRAAARSAKAALELADLALFIAERVPEPEAWRRRLEGYCCAHVGNARRVLADFDGADAAFARAWELWQAGADSDPELLPEWQMLSFEASLRREQQHFQKALTLLDRARAASGENPVAVGRILLKRQKVLYQIGDIERAMMTLVEAAPYVEASEDSQLLVTLRFNMADNLCDLERYGEAAALLPEVRELALQQGDELNLTRLVWLEAMLAAGQGRTEEAIAGLEQVRRNFLDHDLPYHAALASLDLAVLFLEASRTAKVRELAVEMQAVFKAKKIRREAFAALSLFCEAARRESATVELARRVIAEIETVRRSVSSME